MSIELLLPLGLAALATLILPLLIHLVRQSEQLPYDFSALRWLSESERPRRRLRFEDIALLLLRLGLLALIVLLLAVPVLQGEWRQSRHWILASSDVDLDAARSTISDGQAEWRWLAPGFPQIDGIRPALEQPIASLVREFDAKLPASDSMTVLVPDELVGLDAERIALGRKAGWVTVPAASQRVAASIEEKPLRISLRFADQEQESLRPMRAALAALESGEQGRWKIDEATASVPVDASSDAVIWLDPASPDSLQSWILAGGRAIVVDPSANSGSVVLRDANGNAVAREQAVGKGHLVQILRPLSPDQLPMLLDAQFPEMLGILLKGKAPAPTSAYSVEVEPTFVERTKHLQSTELSSLLCLLIAIVFLLERIVATRRRRAT